jgi:hypothetical protein
MRSLTYTAAVVALAVLGGMFLRRDEPDAPATPTAPTSAGVTFGLSDVQCASGNVSGPGTRLLDPEGMHCSVGLSVLNDSDEVLRLPPYSARLVAGSEAFGVWREGMRALEVRQPGSVFDTGIPPGGGALVALWFDVPLEAEPTAVEAPVAVGSPPVRLDFGTCHFSHSADSGSGYCDVNFLDAVRPGKRYAYRISGPGGGSALYYACFDHRQWEVVDPHPTAVSREGFRGQGVITLQQTDQAVFEDNSGAVLTLEPTAMNDTSPGICG